MAVLHHYPFHLYVTVIKFWSLPYISGQNKSYFTSVITLFVEITYPCQIQYRYQTKYFGFCLVTLDNILKK